MENSYNGFSPGENVKLSDNASDRIRESVLKEIGPGPYVFGGTRFDPPMTQAKISGRGQTLEIHVSYISHLPNTQN
jgi:hypothetical protein